MLARDTIEPGFLGQIAESHPRRKKIYLVHDNAAHHKSDEVRDWLARHGHRFHLEHLPLYSPEFNATERIWHYMRIQATHKRKGKNNDKCGNP